MTREEWEFHCSSVKDAMATYAKSFATPISMSEEQGHGIAWGTGSYVEGPSATYLVTAGHVFTDVPKGGRLAHLPVLGGDYIAVVEEPELSPWPVDAAAFAVPPLPVNSTLKAIPPESIGSLFSAVEGELLFWIGFPGYNLERQDALVEARRRRTWFGELETPGMPMLSQAERDWNGGHAAFDSDKHIALHYPSTAKRSVDSPPVAVLHPKGMSGSILWDTQFVRTFRAGGNWVPELAQVCGLVWAALDDPEVVLATKIEHLRSGLPALWD
jgi:hypothetical protein